MTGEVQMNLFQRLIRQWDQLHPYNGVQALKIRRPLEIQTCRRAWHEALDALGLGGVRVSGDSYRHYPLNGDRMRCEVRIHPPQTSLSDVIAGELNRQYGPADSIPFSPFVIPESDGFWMGLGYQHWLADSASIRMLTRNWFAGQFDPAAMISGPVRTSAGGYFSLFGPHRHGWLTGEAILSTMGWHSQFHRARRIETPESFHDMSSRFLQFEALEGLIDRLHFCAHRAGVSVNDYFLAAIAEACNRLVPVECRYHRRQLAVGSAVDLRSKTTSRLDNVFDLVLGFTTVCGSRRDLRNWDTLLRSVAAQTRRQKRGGIPQSSWLRMFVGFTAGNIFPREQLPDFWRKRVSLAGASSNVNLNRCWAGKYHPDPLARYIRAAPTGPMSPMVLTTTTLGDDLICGLTYRPAILSPENALALSQMLLERLEKITRAESA